MVWFTTMTSIITITKFSVFSLFSFSECSIIWETRLFPPLISTMSRSTLNLKGNPLTGHFAFWGLKTSWISQCCWEELGAGGEGNERGWDGWMASLTQWTWISVNSRSWWWTGRPGVLRFMGSQRVGHDWVTDLIWSDLKPTDKLLERCTSVETTWVSKEEEAGSRSVYLKSHCSYVSLFFPQTLTEFSGLRQFEDEL